MANDQSIDVAELRRLVRNGLGRAVLHVQRSDPAPYFEVVRDACLRNHVYDEQVNGRRDHYLWDLIHLSGRPEAIRDALVQSISKGDPDAIGDWTCVPALLRRFAEVGDTSARRALYAALKRDATSDELGDSIVRMDGLEGLVAIAREIGSQFGPQAEFSYGDWAIARAERRFGNALVWSTLERLANSDVDVESFLIPWRKLKVRQEEWAQLHRTRGRTDYSFADVEREIEEQVAANRIQATGFRSGFGPAFMSWGERASESDLRAAADKLVSLDVRDRPRLTRYLRIFRKRPFPLDIAPLLRAFHHYVGPEAAMIDDYDPQSVAGWALPALEHISHPAVRELAFQLRDRSDWWREAWVGLLRKNYKHGDHAFIETSARIESDESVVHELCWDTLKLLKEIRIPEVAGALEIFYDKNPCASCRSDVVEALHSLDALPHWIIEECRYDSYEETRKFVASATGGLP